MFNLKAGPKYTDQEQELISSYFQAQLWAVVKEKVPIE